MEKIPTNHSLSASVEGIKQSNVVVETDLP